MPETFNTPIADDLAARKFSVQPDYFPPDLIAELQRDMDLHYRNGLQKDAGIGRNETRHIEHKTRTDQTLWLDPDRAAPNEYFRLMDALRMDLNREVYLGLHHFEAHYARYAPGGFYKKHRDAFTGAHNRVVSTVTYLTPGWTGLDEGWLVLYDGVDEDRETARILPLSGTLVVFISEDVPHEVLPPKRARSSIAGWYRYTQPY